MGNLFTRLGPGVMSTIKGQWILCMETLCRQKDASIRNLSMPVPRLLLFYRSGNILSSGGNILSSGGNVFSSGGNVFSSGGNIFSSGGNVFFNGRKVLSNSGKAFLSGRNVCKCHLRCDTTRGPRLSPKSSVNRFSWWIFRGTLTMVNSLAGSLKGGTWRTSAMM